MVQINASSIFCGCGGSFLPVRAHFLIARARAQHFNFWVTDGKN
jgi:hypothetical protein